MNPIVGQGTFCDDRDTTLSDDVGQLHCSILMTVNVLIQWERDNFGSSVFHLSDHVED